MGLFGRNKEKKEKFKAIYAVNIMEGLDVTPKAGCACYVFADRFELIVEGKNYILRFDQIIDYVHNSVAENIGTESRHIKQLIINYQSSTGVKRLVIRDYHERTGKLHIDDTDNMYTCLRKVKPISTTPERVDL